MKKKDIIHLQTPNVRIDQNPLIPNVPRKVLPNARHKVLKLQEALQVIPNVQRVPNVQRRAPKILNVQRKALKILNARENPDARKNSNTV
jgi:hypothetical protein